MPQTRVRRGPRVLLAALLAVALPFLLPAAPAGADTVSDATAALRSANLYVADSTGTKVDNSTASSALAGSRRVVKIAIIPAGSATAKAVAVAIGQQLGGRVTVGVFAGQKFDAASNDLCANVASSAAEAAVNANLSQLRSNNDVTATIQTFVAELATASSCSGSGSSSPDSSPSSSGNGWLVVLFLGLAAAAAVGFFMLRGRRRSRRELADARAEIQPLYDRLASDVASLLPGNDPTARQALADASERFNSAGAQLNGARSLAQLAGARRSVLEGLQATRSARIALGVDPGPEVEPIVTPAAPQLDAPQELTVGGQTVRGYPQYTPGAPYYFAGGGGYGGGWYSMPFWETLLIAEALSPGWGFGGWGYGGWGGGYGGGYDSGFDRGFDAGQNSTQDGGGGDWGGGGGWGGGDWGGGGGGGGDWGGGGDSGGSW